MTDAFLHLQANVVHALLQWQKILFPETTFLATAPKLIFTDGSPNLTDPGFGISLAAVYLFCEMPNSVSNLKLDYFQLFLLITAHGNLLISVECLSLLSMCMETLSPTLYSLVSTFLKLLHVFFHFL